MKKLITISAAIIIGLLIFGGVLMDNREDTIQEVEEKVCEIVLTDISNQIINNLINSIWDIVNGEGQIIIKTETGEEMILIPKE